MKSILLIALTMGVLGYFAGSAGRMFQTNQAADSNQEKRDAESPQKRTGRTAIPSTIKSTDTVATLTELPAPELYDRLALWLLDASPADMQEFWNDDRPGEASPNQEDRDY